MIGSAPPRGFRALLSPSAWSELASSGTRHPYHAGTTLLRQGDPGGWVLLALSGRVKVLYAEPDGGEVLLAVRGPGDLLGEFSSRDGGPRSASVVALENGVGYSVPLEHFIGFLRHRRLGSELDRYVMAKVRESAALTWRCLHRPATDRLASLLLDVHDVAGPDHRSPRIIPMSQGALAEALGVARSSIAPVLAVWKRAGLVRIGRGRIELTDVTSFRRLVSSSVQHG